MRNNRPRRKCEMWMSHNRVLIGGNKKTHARNPNFETEETKLLISLWGDPKVQKTLITTHKKHPVIAKLAECMREHGYYRSPEEINTRLKNLKCFYNRIKKDIELGIITIPTWKHYEAMDEILNRPVFGSRLTMQQQQRQHQLRQKCKTEEEDSRELRPEDLLTVEEAAEEPPEEDTDMDYNQLIVPKEEPLDIDETDMNDMENDSDEADNFPKLAAYLRVAPASSTSTNNTTNTPTNKSTELTPITVIASTDIKKSPPQSPKIITTSMGQKSIVVTTQANTTTTAPTSKISLVPTNILLKPQQSNINLKSPHSIFMKNPTTGAISAITSVANSSNSMPMKVLFVNTMPKLPSDNSSLNNDKFRAPAITKPTDTDKTPKISHVAPISNKKHFSQWKYQKTSTPGFRTLLNQLVQLQSQNLEVTKQRLGIERQRFEFEKSIGEKILNVLPMFQQLNGNINNSIVTEKDKEKDKEKSSPNEQKD